VLEERNLSDISQDKTLTSAVVRKIQGLILNGEFPPGSTLPEIPLSHRFDTSRGTIREALRVLADLGLVEIHPHRSADVALLSPQRAREIFSLRCVLEAFAVKLALTEGRMHDAEIAVITQAFDRMRHCAFAGDVFALIEADMNFHWALCSPCGHEILLDHLRGLQMRTRQFIFYTKFLDSDVESEVNAHTPLLRAVLSGEADRAEAAVRDHITSAGERLLIRLSQEQLLMKAKPTQSIEREMAAPSFEISQTVAGGRRSG
jgi:DNA-binding GntR family transcriptional regulator